MSDSQTTLIEKEVKKTEEAKTPAKKSPATNSREMYKKVEESNEKLYENIKAENKALRDSIESSNKQVIDLTNSMKESNDRVAVTLIETEGKISELTEVTNTLTQMLDEMRFATAAEAPAAPVAAEPATIVERAPEPAAAEVPAGNMQEYVTSKDAFNRYLKEFSRRDGELADKHFKNILEKICLMREDYGKLCTNMEKDIKMYSAADVLDSFKAYLVDIENIITDAGVVIGPYGNDGDQIDPMHQRIVNVVTTTDASKNGTIAQRLSDGYEYNGRAIVKEKVNVYKVGEAPAAPAPAPREQPEREILG